MIQAIKDQYKSEIGDRTQERIKNKRKKIISEIKSTLDRH